MTDSQSPIDSETKQILSDLKSIFDRLQVPMLLIGARARLFIFDSQYNVQGRATTDWDVAVQIDNWEHYDRLVSEMTAAAEARFKKTRVVHRFIHLATRLEVDVIPCGDISGDNEEIAWADGNQMSILGLQEAFLNSQIEKIDEGIELQIASLPAFIVLKLMAWKGRREFKDLDDITLVLLNYEDDERVFEELVEEISEGQIEFGEGAIVLLGRDIRKIFREKTLQQVRKVIIEILEKQNQYLSIVVPRNLEEEAWDEAFDTIVKRFQALQIGITDSQS